MTWWPKNKINEENLKKSHLLGKLMIPSLEPPALKSVARTRKRASVEGGGAAWWATPLPGPRVMNYENPEDSIAKVFLCKDVKMRR